MEELRGKKIRARCHTDATDAPPLLVNFGVVPPSTEVLANDDALTIKLYAKGANARFVTVDTEPVAYFARENLAQQPASYAVGLLNAEGKLDLYPSLPIFRLQARVKGVSDELNAPKGPDSMLEQRKLLVESFGSKKKKTEVRTKEANRVEADDKLQKSLTVAAEKSLFTLAETAKREDLPDYDEKTDVPSKCYDLRSLLTAEGWGIATEQAQPLLANAGVVSSWVAATWQALSTWTEADQRRRRRREKLLAYSIYLMKFLKIDRNSLNKPLSQHSSALPDMIGEHFLSLYTEVQDKKRVRTKLLTNKLINTLLIAMLDVEDYVLKNLPLIATDLRMKLDDVIQHLRSVGCSVTNTAAGKRRRSEGGDEDKETTDDGAWKAKLIAPLKFPEVRKRGPKR